MKLLKSALVEPGSLNWMYELCMVWFDVSIMVGRRASSAENHVASRWWWLEDLKFGWLAEIATNSALRLDLANHALTL